MVGDWVYNKHHGKNIRLTPYDFFTHTHNEFGEQELAPFAKPTIGGDLEPIPLTKKILEKNGFVEKEFYSELIVGDFRILCDINNVCVYHNEHVDLDIPIKYLHELQHAMRICCISKQIEL